MKNIEIINRINALDDFIKIEKNIPPKASYAVTRNFNNLVKELEPYEKERVKIVNEYDELIKIAEEPNKKVLENERNLKIAELLDIDVNVQIHKFAFSVIENCENLSTRDIMTLEFMFEE